MITKIAFVAAPTTNMEAMKKFYGDVLGLKMSADMGDMWAEFDAPDGKSIALDPHTPKQVESPSVYVAFETDDIDAEVARIKEAGGTVVQDVWANEHEGKTICKMAILVDPDGNGVMLHEIGAWRVEGDN